MKGSSRLDALSDPDTHSSAVLFEKDLAFFQLFFALINRYCPINGVDLVWMSTDPGGSDLVQVSGTRPALPGKRSKYAHSNHTSRTPKVCEMMQPGCALLDKAAECRVSMEGRPEVYRCHAGLVDIAVPVVCEGRHIATLITGQVLRSHADNAGFHEVLDNVRGLETIDKAQLSAAYNSVPVVTDDDIQDTVNILNTFADYLATTWKRLLNAEEAQKLRLNEAQILRQEMAQILLGGQVHESTRLREIARALGFNSYPNRILVVRLPEDPALKPDSLSSDLEFTRIRNAIEDLVKRLMNTMAIQLHRREICVFVPDNGEGTGTVSEARAHSLAKRIVNYIYRQCNLSIRIGIGRPAPDWRRLISSYQQACAALAQSKANTAVYKEPFSTLQPLSDQVALACEALAQNDRQYFHSTLCSIFVSANKSLSSKDGSIIALRQFLLVAVGAIIFKAHGMACDPAALERWRRDTCEGLELATNTFDLGELWSSCADRLSAEIEQVNSGKHEQLVDRARAHIHRNIGWPEGSQPIVIEEIAALLRVSEGHLSRTFKRITGMTFERYVIEKRIERAQRLLLDPNSRVSEVADKCDFCNPAYFARIFRKVVGCTPTEFSKHPSLHQAASGTPTHRCSSPVGQM
jgi:AraC-like DNA-binding protein